MTISLVPTLDYACNCSGSNQFAKRFAKNINDLVITITKTFTKVKKFYIGTYKVLQVNLLSANKFQETITSVLNSICLMIDPIFVVLFCEFEKNAIAYICIQPTVRADGTSRYKSVLRQSWHSLLLSIVTTRQGT